LDCLSDDPKVLTAEPQIINGLYIHRVRKHYLVCDFQEKTIIVLTVIHSTMDIPNRLLELQPQLLYESQYLQNRLQNKKQQTKSGSP
jgi:hypothetical protein